MKFLIARILYWVGFRPRCSTDIAGHLSRGYGKLDGLGFWEYQLPYRKGD